MEGLQVQLGSCMMTGDGPLAACVLDLVREHGTPSVTDYKLALLSCRGEHLGLARRVMEDGLERLETNNTAPLYSAMLMVLEDAAVRETTDIHEGHIPLTPARKRILSLFDTMKENGIFIDSTSFAVTLGVALETGDAARVLECRAMLLESKEGPCDLGYEYLLRHAVAHDDYDGLADVLRNIKERSYVLPEQLQDLVAQVHKQDTMDPDVIALAEACLQLAKGRATERDEAVDRIQQNMDTLQDLGRFSDAACQRLGLQK